MQCFWLKCCTTLLVILVVTLQRFLNFSSNFSGPYLVYISSSFLYFNPLFAILRPDPSEITPISPPIRFFTSPCLSHFFQGFCKCLQCLYNVGMHTRHQHSDPKAFVWRFQALNRKLLNAMYAHPCLLQMVHTPHLPLSLQTNTCERFG